MNLRAGIAATAFAIGTILAVGPSTLAASVPTAQQRTLWQHVCEDAAKGTLSDQDALVCVHEGFPQWGDGALTAMQRVCEQALGGTYVRRSEFPVELAACFFD